MDAAEFTSIKALETAKAASELTDRDKHLIGLAVTLTRGCQECSGSRIELALQSGLSYETVRAAIDLAAAVNAGVTIRTAISGSELYKAGIEQACSGSECRVGTP